MKQKEWTDQKNFSEPAESSVSFVLSKKDSLRRDLFENGQK